MQDMESKVNIKTWETLSVKQRQLTKNQRRNGCFEEHPIFLYIFSLHIPENTSSIRLPFLLLFSNTNKT